MRVIKLQSSHHSWIVLG